MSLATAYRPAHGGYPGRVVRRAARFHVSVQNVTIHVHEPPPFGGLGAAAAAAAFVQRHRQEMRS